MTMMVLRAPGGTRTPMLGLRLALGILLALSAAPAGAGAPTCLPLHAACAGEDARPDDCAGRREGETWANAAGATAAAWHECTEKNETADTVAVFRQGGPAWTTASWSSGNVSGNRSGVVASVQAAPLSVDASWFGTERSCATTVSTRGATDRDVVGTCPAGRPPDVPAADWGRLLP